jgi:hypothetical protein
MLPLLLLLLLLLPLLLLRLLQIPVYVGGDCWTALRKLLCSLSFMPPELQTSTAVVQTFGNGLYAPQFPARSVCEDYNAICAPVITGFLSETGVDWFRVSTSSCWNCFCHNEFQRITINPLV